MHWSFSEATSTHVFLDNLPKGGLFCLLFIFTVAVTMGFGINLSNQSLETQQDLGFAPRDTNICNPAGAAICSGIQFVPTNTKLFQAL